MTVRGWTFDPDNTNASLEVHVYIGGANNNDPNAEGHGGIIANLDSPDVTNVYGVGGKHRFEATIATGKTGSQPVYAWAINVGQGDNDMLAQSPMTVNISDYVLPNYDYGPAVTLPEGNGTYTIASILDPTLFVEVNGSSTADGANVQLWGEGASDNRQWVFTQNGDGTYTITNAHSGKALDVKDASLDGGANIQQWRVNGSGAQHWWVEDCGDGTYALKVNHSRGFLDVTNAVAANGTNMQQCRGNGSNAQKFIISKSYGLPITLPNGDGVYTVSPSSNKALRLDVNAGSADDGANVQIYNANSSMAQRFLFTRNTDGSYLIANERSGRLLDVAEASRTDGINVQQYGKSYALHRSWWVEDLGDGTYNIKSVYSGRCLDISDGKIVSGRNVQQWRTNGSAAQRWAIDKGVDNPFSGCTMTLSPSSYTYDGAQKTPTVTIKDGSETLSLDSSYTLAWPSGRTNAGTYTVTATGKGSYKGTKTASFTINPKPISSCTITLSYTSYTYDGSQKAPTLTVKDGSTTLVKDADYTVSTPSGRTNVGTYTYTVTGKGNYGGTATASFKINSASVSNATIASIAAATYTGGEICPKPAVTLGSRTLVEGTDFTYSYSGNVSVSTSTSTGKVTVTGKGNYTGSKSATFSITAKSLSSCSVTLSQSSYTYDGTQKSPSVTVKDGSVVLAKDTDYTLTTPSGRTSAGTYTYTVTGKGNYKDAKSATLTISPKDLSSCTMSLSQVSYTYDGTQKSPTVTVKDGSTTLASGTDYALATPGGRTNAGTYTYTAAGKGNYTGSKTATLTIGAKSLSSCTATLSQATYTYDGTQKSPTVTVKDGSTTLTKDTDYTLTTPSGRTNAGTYTYTVTGKGNYKDTKSATLTISPKNLSSCTMSLSQATYTYDGTQKSPTATVKDGSTTLTKDTHYTLAEPGGRTNAGTYTYTATGKGNYTGTKTATLTISPKNLSSCTMTLSQASYTYDGSQKSPSVTVKDGSTTLTKDTHYTLATPGGRTNAGTYAYTATGKGNYTGNKTVSLTISPKNLSSCTMTLSQASYTYDGTQKSPTVTVKDGSTALTKDTHYTLATPGGRTNAGTYTYTASGKDNYTGTATVSLRIEPKNLSGCTMTLSQASYTYDGTQKSPAVTVKDGSTALTKDTHYTLTDPSGRTNAGSYTYTATGKGNYTGTATAKLTISPKNLSACTATLSPSSYTYDGTQKSPTLTVKDGSKTLAKDTDYAATVPGGRTNAGTYTYTVTGKGNYTGTLTPSFTISSAATKDISTCTVSLSSATYTYDGKQKTPTLTVKDGSTTLTAGTHYTVGWPDGRTDAGTYTVTVTGKNGYKGTKTATLTISKAAIRDSDISDIPAQQRTGKALKPKPKVIVGGRTLAEGTDYTLSYADNVEAGTAVVVVRGKGNYEGTASAEFEVVGVWSRVWGQTALDTMRAIAAEFGGARVAVVTTNADFKDALAASALAGQNGALVLTTPKGSVASQTKAALKAAGVRTVYVVGSASEVTDKTMVALKSGTGVTKVERVGGKTASARAIAAAKKCGKRSDTVIIATQASFKDALSIAPYSYATKSPILYAETDKKLSNDTLRYIKSAGYKKAIVVGGPVALPASIDTQLANSAGIKKASVTRLAGTNSYDTSLLIARWATGQLSNRSYGTYQGKALAYVRFQPSVQMGAEGLAVATGQGWKDALCGAALCGQNHSVLLLGDAANSAKALEFTRASARGVSSAYVLGGPSAVSEGVWDALVASTAG